jgi:putative ABC transport system permease protein
METLLRDMRGAIATMRRNPGFTMAGLVTLALGIGATTAVFSVVDGVLLRPLPYPFPDRLVTLSEEHPGAASPLRAPMLSNLTYHAWKEAPVAIDAIAAYSGRQYTVALPDGAARLDAAAVSPGLFTLLGAVPELGRLFREEEASPGANTVIVLSYRLWRDRFGSDPAVLNRSVLVDGAGYTIVGVARRGFAFPAADTMLWTPYLVPPPAADAAPGGSGTMSVVRALARLAPRVTPAQAAAEGTAAARRTIRPMAADLIFGTSSAPVVVHAQTMLDEMTTTVRPALAVLAAAVGLVLLVACANVANLFLSRGVARQRELTVRAALGASAGRLARQLLTESLVLSACGGALGVAVAWSLLQLVPALASRDFPRLDGIRIDARVITMAAAAALFTALGSGLAPAWRGARFDLAESLHGGDGATAGGFRGLRARRLRDGLLIVEAAFAVVLLVGASLLAHSFVRLTRVDAGYTADHVLAAQVFVPGYDAPRVPTPADAGRTEHIATVVSAILERLRAMPGVAAAGAGNMMPLDSATLIGGFPAPWSPGGGKPATARALPYTVTPGYAEALNLRLRSGRLLAEADRASGIRAWIVNQEFARLYLPPDPLGYRFEQQSSSGPIPIEIIGVVGNVLKNGNDARPQPEYYRLPRDLTRFDGRFELALRTVGDPAALAPAVRRIVNELEPTAAVEITPLPDRVAASVAQPRFATTVLVTFAVVALALASVGLYGVLTYSVAQRRRELGVRAALGAARADLIRLVLREGLRVTAVGIVVGLVAAAAATRLMQGLLFGVGPLDAMAFAIAPAVLIPIAVVACLVPAARAAATDPADALRL